MMASCRATGVSAAAAAAVAASSVPRVGGAGVPPSHVSLKGRWTMRGSMQGDATAFGGYVGVLRHFSVSPAERSERTKRSPVASAEPTVSASEAAEKGEKSTLDIVREVISNQLAVKATDLEPTTKFADLGADSLDTVEIMMTLEEKFNITMEEDGTEKIATVHDAATLIDQMKNK